MCWIYLRNYVNIINAALKFHAWEMILISLRFHHILILIVLAFSGCGGRVVANTSFYGR